MSAQSSLDWGDLAHLEEVDGGAGVEGGLLVDGSQNGGLLRLGRVEGGREVELETLGDLVLELELRAEQVGGGPGLDVSEARVDAFQRREANR